MPTGCLQGDYDRYNRLFRSIYFFRFSTNRTDMAFADAMANRDALDIVI